MLKRPLLKNLFSKSVSHDEMTVFNTITNWWHPNGPNQMLHLYNYQRIKFLKKNITLQSFNRQPFEGYNIIDIGCGAGFLSQSLTRLGGNVIGLDPNQTSFVEATKHKGTKLDLNKLIYVQDSVENYAAKNPHQLQTFDLVTSMEVIQHVNDPQQFLKNIAGLCKEQGLVMISTIRRSVRTYLTHIVGAQKITRIVPEGTHHHQKFINPEECERMMKEAGIKVVDKEEFKINWKGQFEKEGGGGNYLMLGKKSAKVVIE